MLNGGKWGQGLRDDTEEEAYFNTSDDEDELAAPEKTVLNGASPVRPLVNYPDDDAEEDDIDMDVPLAMRNTGATIQTKDETKTPKANSTVGSPPERISEKRRREEDEEDELLANISTTTAPKRRASTSSNTSTSSLRSLRRKSPQINSGKDGGTPKKISISLPVKSGGENNGSE